MLDKIVQAMGQDISKQFPHMKIPSVVYASVASVQKLEDTYEAEKLEITEEDGSRTYTVSVKAHWYEYTLSVLDRFGRIDQSFPPLPGIRSKMQSKVGATVAVGLAYGDLAPVIIGEAFV